MGSGGRGPFLLREVAMTDTNERTQKDGLIIDNNRWRYTQLFIEDVLVSQLLIAEEQGDIIQLASTLTMTTTTRY